MTYRIAIGVFLLDRITKLIAINHLFLERPVEIIHNIFSLTLIFNSGTAFGLFKSQRLPLIIVSIAVMAVITYYVMKHKDMPSVLIWPLGLVLGGAAGNLVDRLTTGYVIDFFDFHIWPVFNIADSCLTIGVIMLAFNIWAGNSRSKT